MIKKLLCLLLILSTAFIIVACKKDEPDDQHDHTLVATEAVAATCTEDGTNAYWTCSECNKVFADEAATTETTVDAQKITALGHDYAAATCTAPKTCKREGCNSTEGEALGHDFEGAEVWGYRGADGHALKCNNCNAYGTVVAHTSSGPATEQAAEVCTVCEYEIANKINHNHSPAAEWSSDGSYHWHACTANDCDAHVGEEAHTPAADDNDCTTATLCTVCNHVLVAAEDDHKYSADCDEKCDNEGCEYTRETNAGHIDSNDDGKCDSCGADYTENEGGTDVDDPLLTPPDEF